MNCNDQMHTKDLTINEVLTDPLILQMMQADRVSISGMHDLLQDAARKQETRQSLIRRPRLSALGAAFRAGCRGSA